MFRILFFILICTLFFYSFVGFYSPIKNISEEKISSNFEQYLSGALSRNTPKTQFYGVVFFRKDFIDEGSSQKSKKIGENTTYLNNNSTLTYQKNEEGRSKKGFFGTPSIASQGVGYQSNCKGGLIFAPCLIIGDPIPASGGMHFGSDKS